MGIHLVGGLIGTLVITIDFLQKVRLEVVVPDDQADVVINTIVEAARTGSVGDGKVWSSHIDEVVRIRTGERGRAAV